MAGLTFNREHVFKIMEQNDLPYWELYAQDGLKPAISQNEDISVEESVDELRNTLLGVEGTSMRVRVCNNPFPLGAGQPKNQKLFDFNIKLRNAINGAPVVKTDNSGGGSADRQMIYQLMEKMNQTNLEMKEQGFKYQLDLMQRQFDDFKKEAENKHPLAGFIKNLEPYSPLIAQHLTGVNLGVEAHTLQPGIAGTQDTPEEAEKKKQLLLATLSDMKQLDANFEMNLYNISKVAKANPSQYAMYMQMVKAQADAIK